MTDERPRLGLFVPELTGGGAERVTINLARAFHEWGADVDLIVVKAVGAYVSHVPKGVRLIELGARGTATSIPALRRYLRDERPHAVISALHHANVALLVAKKLSYSRSMVVVTIHNAFSAQMQSATGVRSKVLPAMIRVTYPWADGIVTVSKGVADDFAATVGIDRARIDTIYNPVVTEAVLEQARQPAFHPWLGDGGAPVVVAIGRLTPQKDFPTLIRAIDLVRMRHPVRLLLLGEGPLRGELQSLVHELDLQALVDLPGFVDNPHAILARADLFVLSSLWEGLPTVLIEALAAAVPVISTDCPSGPAEILLDGQYGRLVPVGRPDALADAICESLREPLLVDPSEACQRFTIRPAMSGYLRLVGLDPDA